MQFRRRWLWYLKEMDDALLGIVLERLADNPLPAQAEDFLLAAFDGDEELAAQLNAPAARRYPRATGTLSEDPVGAYLRSVTVTGFRGIGPAATLEVAPGPGLTLVVGRNGSGKSSFAEALEVLLTGTLLRWAPPAPAVVKNGWRSKHATDATGIQAEFLIEGSGRATGRAWPSGADFSGSTAWLQRAGEKRAALEELGWDADLRNTARSCRTPSLRRSSEGRRNYTICSRRCLALRTSLSRTSG